jgi:hypothetical protein
MPRPTSQPALDKAPKRDHPAVPLSAPAPGSLPPPTDLTEHHPRRLAMFSARIDLAVRRRVKRFAAETDETLQAITEAALTEYLDRRGTPK